jgi:hypothetical protein
MKYRKKGFAGYKYLSIGLYYKKLLVLIVLKMIIMLRIKILYFFRKSIETILIGYHFENI